MAAEGGCRLEISNLRKARAAVSAMSSLEESRKALDAVSSRLSRPQHVSFLASCGGILKLFEISESQNSGGAGLVLRHWQSSWTR